MTGLRLLALVAVVLLLLVRGLAPETCAERSDCPPPSPPPCGSWETRLQAVADGTGSAAKDNAACPQRPQASTPFEYPKADLAILRRPLLALDFFARPDTDAWQADFIAAELTVDRSAREAAFAALVARADSAFLRWRAEIGLARTALAYGDGAMAEKAAGRALAAVTEGGLDRRLAADALYALAVASEDRVARIALLDRAIAADGGYFDAHLALLSATAESVSSGAQGAEFARLLDLQMRSIEFVAGLADRSLLAELQLALAQVSGAETPEAAVLGAYVAWLAGRVAEAESLAVETLAACPPEGASARPGCARLRALAAAMASGRARADND